MTEIIQITLLGVIIALLLMRNIPKNVNVKLQKGGLLLDSSAIIDGRIVEIAKSGFIPGNLIVPRFIVHELQLIADSKDSHKRERARFGLDVITQLQEELKDKLILSDINPSNVAKTDDKLVAAAKMLDALLCTTDYNLNKVATVESVKVLNVNELANAVRPNAIPGEADSVKIIQRGSSKNQGVGYLEDGTMVVVEGTGDMIGRQVEIVVTRMLQSDAGKMIFAKKARK